MPDKVWVQRLVESDAPPSTLELRRLIREFAISDSRIETDFLEFKEAFEDTTRNWNELLKDLAAFSNSLGGFVVFGITNSGKAVGCDPALLTTFDAANVHNHISNYSPQASLTCSCFRVAWYRKSFVFLRINPGADVIIFDKDGNYALPGGAQKQAFHQGVVYVRHGSRNTPATLAQVRAMVDERSRNQLLKMISRIEKVAQAPADAEIIIQPTSQTGTGYRLVGDGEAVPVRISEEANAIPIAISEVVDPTTPFSSTSAEAAGQVRHWRQRSPDHRVDRRTLVTWYQLRDEVQMDDDLAEFCFLSAADDHGFPLFWASQMSSERLDDVVRRESNTLRYPVREVLPWVVGALLWDKRSELLEPLTHCQYIRVRNNVQRVLDLDRDDFLRQARFRGEGFSIENEYIEFSSLVSDREEAADLFIAIQKMEADRQCPVGLKSVAHQMDIALHAS